MILLPFSFSLSVGKKKKTVVAPSPGVEPGPILGIHHKTAPFTASKEMLMTDLEHEFAWSATAPPS